MPKFGVNNIILIISSYKFVLPSKVLFLLIYYVHRIYKLSSVKKLKTKTAVSILSTTHNYSSEAAAFKYLSQVVWELNSLSKQYIHKFLYNWVIISEFILVVYFFFSLKKPRLAVQERGIFLGGKKQSYFLRVPWDLLALSVNSPVVSYKMASYLTKENSNFKVVQKKVKNKQSRVLQKTAQCFAVISTTIRFSNKHYYSVY